MHLLLHRSLASDNAVREKNAACCLNKVIKLGLERTSQASLRLIKLQLCLCLPFVVTSELT
jgi:hypothetical protein